MMIVEQMAVYLLLTVLSVPAVIACGYLLILTLLSRTPAPPPRSSRSLSFDIIVPAHNEAAGIQRIVANLKKIDWPTDQYRIVVIADNCTDETADLARAAGAAVIERHDSSRRGKGYALEVAFKDSLDRGLANAVVVVDADSEVTSNLLEAFAAKIESGASAVQAHYGVSNPQLSWHTRLLTIALAAFHIVRSRARDRMYVSCGVRGNGWCVMHRLLRKVPYRAFSLTEDLEYGIDIGLAGYRVHYADEASVNCEMVANKPAAAQQRRRWETGRLQLIKSRLLPLISAMRRQRNAVAVDLLLDLLVLPLSYVVLNVIALVVFAGVAHFFFSEIPGTQVWLWLGIACGICIVVHVARGWQLSGIGKQGFLDLLHAPGFILWKTLLLVRSRAPVQWVRTKRESL